ncbi:Cytochrome P450 1A1 [Leucoagaricus sp. SymC.cos]|nr:Cytochrome P450 1A1 [Leucoagaricus sp. SymC.cos]
MLTLPDVQRLAQREIGSVVGRDWLPDFLDLERLPYLTAIIKEVLHASLQFDFLTLVTHPSLTEHIAVLHYEDVSTDPEEFKFSRFLNSKGTIRDELPDPEKMATFGFGHNIANRSLAKVDLQVDSCTLAYGGLALLTSHVATAEEIQLVASAVHKHLGHQVLAFLPTSQSYLKIIDVPYFWPGTMDPMDSDYVKGIMAKSHMAPSFTLAKIAMAEEIQLVASAVYKHLGHQVLAFLSTSQSYLKIIDVPYFRPGTMDPMDYCQCSLRHAQLHGIMAKSHMAPSFTLANAPCIMCNSMYSDLATVWFNIVNS